MAGQRIDIMDLQQLIQLKKKGHEQPPDRAGSWPEPQYGQQLF